MKRNKNAGWIPTLGKLVHTNKCAHEWFAAETVIFYAAALRTAILPEGSGNNQAQSVLAVIMEGSERRWIRCLNSWFQGCHQHKPILSLIYTGENRVLDWQHGLWICNVYGKRFYAQVWNNVIRCQVNEVIIKQLQQLHTKLTIGAISLVKHVTLNEYRTYWAQTVVNKVRGQVEICVRKNCVCMRTSACTYAHVHTE